jgi:hypothetical protein
MCREKEKEYLFGKKERKNILKREGEIIFIKRERQRENTYAGEREQENTHTARERERKNKHTN